MNNDTTPKILLTPPLRLWLEAACHKLLKGEKPDSRTLTVELLGKLPENFNSVDIDARLMRNEEPTLLGLALVAPELDIIQKANQVWRGIHTLLRTRPTSEIITADEIADVIHLPKIEVAEIFEKLSRIGLFSSGTTYWENGRYGWETIRVNSHERAFDRFVRFENMDQFLASITQTGSLLNEDNNTILGQNSTTVPLSKKPFKVALSFPGEKRSYVNQVAQILQNQIGDVFYDYFFEAELAQPNLDVLLQKIYHDNSDLVVVFLCDDYERKEWCGLEWRAVRDLIKRRHDNIMLMRFDDAEVSGIFSIDGYVDLRKRSPEQAAELIAERYKIQTQKTPTKLENGMPDEFVADASPEDQTKELISQLAFHEMQKTIGEVSSALLFYANTASKLINEELKQEATRAFRKLSGDLLGKQRMVWSYEVFEKHNLLPSRKSISEASKKLMLLSNIVGDDRHEMFSDTIEQIKTLLWIDI